MTSAGNIDKLIVQYSDKKFNADNTAMSFFSAHSDSEVNKKLRELGALQSQIESILRIKVGENYGLFMYANREIQRVGLEMTQLNELLEITKNLLLEVRNLKESDVKIIRNERKNLSVPVEKPGMLRVGESEKALNIPLWVQKAAEDVDRYMVEHQYKKAVGVILRTKSYTDSLRSAGIEIDATSVGMVGAKIQSRADKLADVLRASLDKLPNSQLWGVGEQTKRLRLLIALGHSEKAAEGFSNSRKDVIRKALRYVEASGDPEAYTAELSRVFFLHLHQACEAFMDLFNSPLPAISIPLTSNQPVSKTTATTNRKNATGSTSSAAISKPATASLASSSGTSSKTKSAVPSNPNVSGKTTDNSSQSANSAPVVETSDSVDIESLSYLVEWIQEQMAVFVATLARQIQVGAAQNAARVIDILCMASSSQSDNLSPRTMRASSRASLTPPASLGLKRTSSGGNSVSKRSSSAMSIGKEMDLSNLSVMVGPLSFVSRCLQVAFRESLVLDQLGLQGASALGWHLLPEIRMILGGFADSMIRALDAEVFEENWSLNYVCKTTKVTYPGQDKVATTPTEKRASTPHRPPRQATTTVSKLFASSATVDEDEEGGGGGDGDKYVKMEAVDDENSELYSSACYEKAIILMSYFVGELWVLHKATAMVAHTAIEEASKRVVKSREAILSKKPGAENRRKINRRYSTFETHRMRMDQSYGRADLCELEAEAVACLLRILVRYIRAVLSVDTKDFAPAEKTSYRRTIQRIQRCMLPSVGVVVEECFFSDGSTLVDNPPSKILETLGAKLDIIYARLNSYD